VLTEELLGKDLASLELGPSPCRTDDPQTSAIEFVGNSIHERLLGPYHRQICTKCLGKIGQSRNVRQISGNTLGLLRNAAISWGTPYV
jgi:hypothetical protein